MEVMIRRVNELGIGDYRVASGVFHRTGGVINTVADIQSRRRAIYPYCPVVVNKDVVLNGPNPGLASHSVRSTEFRRRAHCTSYSRKRRFREWSSC